MERKVPLIEGEHFHIYNRGVDKRDIFLDSHDYNRFLMLMYLCNSSKPVDIRSLFNKGRSFVEVFDIPVGSKIVDVGAWVLMPNHFHMVLKSNIDNGITDFFKKLCTGYSLYFNKKHDRSGSLFQGRFKSQHVENDEYLKYLFSYVHLNPVKLIPGESQWKDMGLKNRNNAEDFIRTYKYSSFLDYLNKGRIYENIISRSLFSDVNDNFDQMIEEMFDWIDVQETTTKDRPL
jgi:putative transposase